MSEDDLLTRQISSSEFLPILYSISKFRKPPIGEASKSSKNAIIENGASIGKNVTIHEL